MRKATKDFVEHVKAKTKAAGIKTELRNVKHLRLGDGCAGCAGYFCEEDSLLVVATNRPEKQWLAILAHEFSHFEQWQENCPSWSGCLINGVDLTEDYYRWCARVKEMNVEVAMEAMTNIRRLELDCERRSVVNIIKYDLGLDLDKYKQQSASYIHFYNWTFLRRAWYKTGRSPSEIRAVWSHMPKTLSGHFVGTPDKYLELFDRHCT